MEMKYLMNKGNKILILDFLINTAEKAQEQKFEACKIPFGKLTLYASNYMIMQIINPLEAYDLLVYNRAENSKFNKSKSNIVLNIEPFLSAIKDHKEQIKAMAKRIRESNKLQHTESQIQ